MLIESEKDIMMICPIHSLTASVPFSAASRCRFSALCSSWSLWASTDRTSLWHWLTTYPHLTAWPLRSCVSFPKYISIFQDENGIFTARWQKWLVSWPGWTEVVLMSALLGEFKLFNMVSCFIVMINPWLSYQMMVIIWINQLITCCCTN